MDKFDNTINIDETIMESINNMLKYQNYKLVQIINN